MIPGVRKPFISRGLKAMLLNSELEREFVIGASVFELAKSDNSEICSASKLTVGTCNILIQIFPSCYLKGSDVF